MEKLNIILDNEDGLKKGDLVEVTLTINGFIEGDIATVVSPEHKDDNQILIRSLNGFACNWIWKIYLKPVHRHAILKPSRGKKKGFYFNLVGDNFEIVGTSEVYTTKAMARKTLKKYFPSFKITDSK